MSKCIVCLTEFIPDEKGNCSYCEESKRQSKAYKKAHPESIILTNENYYSQQSNLGFMSASQYKSFNKCPASAMAELVGEWEHPMSTALLVGSYVDAHFEGTLDLFTAKHPEIFTQKGTLRADYIKAIEIIERIEKDDFFMAHLSGEKQTIMTGEISGVPFKIKTDVYVPDSMIVDLKVMRDFEWQFDPEIRKRIPFVEFWGYDIQAAIYQEIVRQNTGELLPFFIAGATKESVTDIEIISISQEQLNFRLGQVKRNAPAFQKIKQKEEGARRCGKCDYCKRTKVLTSVKPFNECGNG